MTKGAKIALITGGTVAAMGVVVAVGRQGRAESEPPWGPVVCAKVGRVRANCRMEAPEAKARSCTLLEATPTRSKGASLSLTRKWTRGRCRR